MRRTQRLASLKATQKDSRFDPRRCPKRRRFDFSMKPYDWLLIGTHGGRYVRSDIRTRCEPQLFPSRYFPRQFHITFRASPACRRAAQADRRHARRLSRTVTSPSLRRQGAPRRGAPRRGMPLLCGGRSAPLTFTRLRNGARDPTAVGQSLQSATPARQARVRSRQATDLSRRDITLSHTLASRPAISRWGGGTRFKGSTRAKSAGAVATSDRALSARSCPQVGWGNPFCT